MANREGLSLAYHRRGEHRSITKVSNLLVWAKPTGKVALVKVGPRNAPAPTLAIKLAGPTSTSPKCGAHATS